MCLAADKTIAVRILTMVVAIVPVLALVWLLLLTDARADDATLAVTPNKCVALREGQTCYLTLRIRFVASTIGNYCLRVAEQPSPLKCWSSITSAEYRYQLASTSSLDFEVVNTEQVQVAVTRVTNSWVYKKTRSRSRWRIF